MVDFPHEECPSIAIVIFFISLETYFSAKVMKKNDNSQMTFYNFTFGSLFCH